MSFIGGEKHLERTSEKTGGCLYGVKKDPYVLIDEGGRLGRWDHPYFEKVFLLLRTKEVAPNVSGGKGGMDNVKDNAQCSERKMPYDLPRMERGAPILEGGVIVNFLGVFSQGGGRETTRVA